MRKIRKGDEVVVRSGKDKGKSGEVLEVLSDGEQLRIRGINLAKKHMKANPQRKIEGGIIEMELPLRTCKVGVLDPATRKATRVGIRVAADGKKERYFKSSNEPVDIIDR